ncbi:MAG: DUF4197 domain-containing protein [Chitinophagales bacterium]
MIKNSILALLTALIVNSGCAQVTHPATTPAAPQDTRPGSSTIAPDQSQPSSTNSNGIQGALSGLDSDHLVSGLKEALSLSAVNSSTILSATDGFFKNQAIKILMPPDVKMVETKLRSLGLGSEVDKALLSMNRAAEEAAKDAAPIFLDAIKGMSVNDAFGLIKGPNDAATQYLKKSTSAQLTEKFAPVIGKALDKTEATKYWSDVFGTYNKLPFVKPVDSDLKKYVTQKALDGLFYTMAQEEAKIRKDPAGTANSIIESVFGKH